MLENKKENADVFRLYEEKQESDMLDTCTLSAKRIPDISNDNHSGRHEN